MVPEVILVFLGLVLVEVTGSPVTGSHCLVVATGRVRYFHRTVDVIYTASNKDNTAPGAPGEVQDHQEHHQDDQEQLQDHFYVGFDWF